MPPDHKFILGGLSYSRKLMADMAKRIRSITSLLKQGVKFVLTPAMEAIVRTLLAKYRPRRLRSTLTGTRSPTTPALSSSTATLASMILEPPSSRNKRTAHSALLFPSAALPSSLSITGQRSISRLAVLSGASSASVVTCGAPPSAFFRATRRSRASPRLPCTTPESRDGSNSSRHTAILWSTGKEAPTIATTFHLGNRCLRRRITAAAAAA